jgi:hypothetical protein
VPTHEERPQFATDYASLTEDQQLTFRAALRRFVADLRRGTFRPGLRVKRVQTHAGVWEMTWAPDGRATFHYGAEIIPGEPHVVWRRVGTHDVFRRP